MYSVVNSQMSESATNDVANLKDVMEFIDVNNEEELRKYFVSLGLSIKFKNAGKESKISGSKISMTSLFEKAREMDLPIEKWYSFLLLELGYTS